MLLGRDCQEASALSPSWVGVAAVAFSTRRFSIGGGGSVLSSIYSVLDISTWTYQYLQTRIHILDDIFPHIYPPSQIMVLPAQSNTPRHNIGNFPRDFLFILLGRGPPTLSQSV
jgi:hypothetical protein